MALWFERRNLKNIDPILNFVLEWWPSWIQNLHLKPKYCKVEPDKLEEATYSY